MQEMYGMTLNTTGHGGKGYAHPNLSGLQEADEDDRQSALDGHDDDVSEPPIVTTRRTRRALSLRSTFMPPAQLFRADVLLNRLREFGVMGSEEEEIACVVDVKSVYQDLPPFLKDMLPVWDKDDPHSHYITYFKHDPVQVCITDGQRLKFASDNVALACDLDSGKPLSCKRRSYETISHKWRTLTCWKPLITHAILI
jgi:hypothetical protein